VSDDSLTATRCRFAEKIAKLHEITDRGLVEAFASVSRERYLGPGPWHVLRSLGYSLTPNDDPALVYVNAAIALDPGHNINNGEPGLHIGLMAHLGPQAGDHVVQVGVGGGY
jgi:protein-L-isoaspartate(D-aspartate) O-methyltransferase